MSVTKLICVYPYGVVPFHYIAELPVEHTPGFKLMMERVQEHGLDPSKVECYVTPLYVEWSCEKVTDASNIDRICEN